MYNTTRAAGEFSSWLATIRKGGASEVPCGDCNACCRASYFVHIKAHEADAIEHIPKALRVPAPGQPEGNTVMGFSDAGCCPMLRDGQCSIYQHRPQTCRDYDCRIFAACGIAAGETDKQAVNEQIARWRFDYPTETDKREQRAVVAAMKFLQTRRELFDVEVLPDNPTQLALLALSAYHLFENETGNPQNVAAAITAIIERRQS